ncbi:MAG: NAD(P)H-binding protein, partial [Candidatus Dadabacteria bacterium]|nr:NAD(P)H-binding protein [Candidatus Dadabacteria bacterium]
MKAILTGATGFIGKNLVNYLLKRNYKVRVLIRDKKKFQINDKNVEIYVGDITRIRDVTRALNGVYAAYYLAHSMSE